MLFQLLCILVIFKLIQFGLFAIIKTSSCLNCQCYESENSLYRRHVKKETQSKEHLPDPAFHLIPRWVLFNTRCQSEVCCPPLMLVSTELQYLQPIKM